MEKRFRSSCFVLVVGVFLFPYGLSQVAAVDIMTAAAAQISLETPQNLQALYLAGANGTFTSSASTISFGINITGYTGIATLNATHIYNSLNQAYFYYFGDIQGHIPMDCWFKQTDCPFDLGSVPYVLGSHTVTNPFGQNYIYSVVEYDTSAGPGSSAGFNTVSHSYGANAQAGFAGCSSGSNWTATSNVAFHVPNTTNPIDLLPPKIDSWFLQWSQQAPRCEPFYDFISADQAVFKQAAQLSYSLIAGQILDINDYIILENPPEIVYGDGGGGNGGGGNGGDGGGGGLTWDDAPIDSELNCSIIDIPCNLRLLFIPQQDWISKFSSLETNHSDKFPYALNPLLPHNWFTGTWLQGQQDVDDFDGGIGGGSVQIHCAEVNLTPIISRAFGDSYQLPQQGYFSLCSNNALADFIHDKIRVFLSWVIYISAIVGIFNTVTRSS